MVVSLSKVSDRQIDAEYRKRFFLKAGDRISQAQDAARHFNLLMAQDPAREHFGIIYLNGMNRVIHSEILFSGSLTSAAVYPREIIKRALKANAGAILCGHNHPSGNHQPSRDDLQITKKIKTACEAVDIVLHDHLILGDRVYSFADNGLV